MIIWLKKSDGSCVRLTDPWKPKIHVGGSFRDLLDLACRPGLENAIFVERYEKAGDRERSRVLEVEVDGDREAVGLARKLEQFGRYSSSASTTSTFPLRRCICIARASSR